MSEETLHTEEELDGKDPENKDETIEQKYERLSLDLDEANKRYETLKNKYHEALEANNKLYKRLTAEPPTEESTLDKILKNYK